MLKREGWSGLILNFLAEIKPTPAYFTPSAYKCFYELPEQKFSTLSSNSILARQF
jgi:hypothetical protein